VEAHWELPVAGARHSVYEALIQIYAYNTITLIADITGALAEMKVSILQINSQKRSNERIIINLKISCKNIEHYKSIVSRLKDLSGVESVTRGFS
jgi:(p)ppGpp synthase/HD superfamily hydrolase